MRTAFIKQLVEEARTNDKIVLIVGDLGYHVVEPFAEAFPDRFFNAGISEQMMAGMAAGMAMAGFNVYIYSIGNFPTLRCLEQIRNDIAYPKASVKIVAVGAGFSYGSQGFTHHSTEDIGIMRCIPNMIVATPGDPIEAKAITNISASYDGPMYIRLGKAGEQIIHQQTITPFQLGDILPVLTGKRSKAVMACGSIMSAAYNEVTEKKLPVDLYSVPFVKPLNRQQLREIAMSHDELIVLEEHQRACGVGSAILEELHDIAVQDALFQIPKVRLNAIDDKFFSVAGCQDYLRQIARLSIA